MIRLLWTFLKEHRAELFMYAGFLSVFYVVFYLYHVRIDAVQYAYLLSAILIFAYETVAFIRFIRKHGELLEAERKISAEVVDLPESISVIEEDYQRILRKVYDEKIDLEEKSRDSKREMREYYGMWVHQIKTPIAALRVLLQTCGQTEDESTRTFVKEMKLELFKIEQYVEMVLTYLRIGDMNSDFVFEQYSLDDIIRQAVRKYSQMFIFGKIKLNYEPVNKVVLTDEKWLVFVIGQILSNALKYTKKGSISIYVEKGRKGKEFLVIEDTGIGILPEDLPRVFEKGFTGYNGREDKKATGIGLYLCKSVMDKLRHTIWIDSEAGKGTKVYMYLERENLTGL